jgi:glycerophosphoryl diester phosphodiesterase
MRIIAHRGASAEAPENTMEALRLAWRQGADGAEIDVRVTRDGEVVLLHDAGTRRTAGCDGVVARRTWRWLAGLDAGAWKGDAWRGARIPRLAQAIEELPDGKFLLIEIKSAPDSVPAIARVLRRHAGRIPFLRVLGFNRAVLAALRRELPAAYCLPNIGRRERAARGIAATLRLAASEGWRGLSLSYEGKASEAEARAAKAAGLEVAWWTVDEPGAARVGAAAGVDWLITNRPGLLRRELGRR